MDMAMVIWPWCGCYGEANTPREWTETVRERARKEETSPRHASCCAISATSFSCHGSPCSTTPTSHPLAGSHAQRAPSRFGYVPTLGGEPAERPWVRCTRTLLLC